VSRSGWIRVAVVVVALIAVAGALLLWSRAASTQAQFLTAPVEKGDITVAVSANGTLNPVTLVNVGTQVSGTVRKLHVDYNSRVRQGEVLLELDDSIYAAALHQSEASLTSALAQVELAAANARRSEELFAKGYVAQQELDQAREVATAAVAQRDLVRAQLARDRANLGYTVIRSPVAGVVVSREVDVGQTVAASFQTPTLFKIAQDLSKMQIDSNFAEADIGRIRVGQPVRFNVDAFPDRTFTGSVAQVRLNPTTVQNVVTYDVVVAVENPEQILLPGMTAYVNVLLSERHDVLKIPNAALRFRPPGVEAPVATPPASPAASPAAATGAPAAGPRPDGPHRPGAARKTAVVRPVYVMRNGAPVAVQVQLGGTDRRYTELVSGELKEGEQLAVGVAGAGGTGQQPPPGTPRVRMF
jgi:HlyD family secretion protein